MNRQITQIILSVFFITIFLSCTHKGDTQANKEKWKEEIRKTEAQFAEMAAKEGLKKAFLYYADETAVLMRNNKLIAGKDSIALSLKGFESPDGYSLTWAPDFIDVSDSGDMGYTYGNYTFSSTDTTGATNSQTGVFHTVWKRQADGTWRYVWD